MDHHICVVDDDPDILRLVTVGLEAAGFQVSALSDSLKALAEIERLQPDLLILDIEMPGKSGLQLCADIRMKPELQDIPVLFLTSRLEIQTRIRGMQGGAIDYVTKPFRVQDLISSIRAVLAVRGD